MFFSRISSEDMQRETTFDEVERVYDMFTNKEIEHGTRNGIA
jgi:hypothetical protein